MSLEFLWSLPTDEALQAGARQGVAPLRHWINAARAAEVAGFHGLLLPSGPRRPDAWLLAVTLAAHVRQIRFLVGLRPGFVLPAVAAQRAATLLQIAGPRLAFSVLAGGDSAEHRTYGDSVNHDDRFARASEYLHVLRQAWKGRGSGAGLAHQGNHYRLEGGGLHRPPTEPLPPLYIGGGTPAAERVAAEHAQVFFHWAAAPAAFAERLQRVGELAAAHGRSLRFGVRVHLVARDTEAAARAAAHAGVLAPGALQSSAADSYPEEVSPHLFTIPGWPRTSAGPAGGAILVGSHAQVAERLEALHALGVDSFILSADDALGDPLRIAEEILPLVRPAARARAALAPEER